MYIEMNQQNDMSFHPWGQEKDIYVKCQMKKEHFLRAQNERLQYHFISGRDDSFHVVQNMYFYKNMS